MPLDPAGEQLLHRALDLACAGIGLASPNPHVGAVITDAQGKVVGEGTYTYDGRKHAEILALEAAGPKARGGTLYINLEPHAHQGRTPPCTDALIAAGIRRVVASMADPNPKVRGRGFDQLRAAGIEVEVGALEQPARRLNEAFACYIRRAVPFVTLKSAMTLDGKIAPEPQSSSTSRHDGFSGYWITGESARAHVHQLRHEHDAILAGIGTVLADNPLLTDRSGRPRRRRLLRVILDSHLRLPLDSRVLKRANREGNNDVLLLFCSADAARRAELERAGARVEKVPANVEGRIDLTAVLRCLAELEITSLMIEGGSAINAAALAANIVDKVFLYYAPKIFGTNAVPFAAANESPTANEAAQLKDVTLHRFGEDFALEGYLRDPYR
jgi:diaminohydroxyphosphoribosylaminopyrimidine deaminase/5-amino-6-(5-phosphoribosylamino)uracil reductase